MVAFIYITKIGHFTHNSANWYRIESKSVGYCNLRLSLQCI